MRGQGLGTSCSWMAFTAYWLVRGLEAWAALVSKLEDMFACGVQLLQNIWLFIQYPVYTLAML